MPSARPPDCVASRQWHALGLSGRGRRLPGLRGASCPLTLRERGSVVVDVDHVASVERWRRAARRAGWLLGWSVRIGVSADGHNPLVYGEWLKAPGKPTLLLYGHYDVQPAEPLEEWNSPPFEPTVRGDNLFSRGASDDKGQTYILMQAVRSFAGKLPVNVPPTLKERCRCPDPASSCGRSEMSCA